MLTYDDQMAELKALGVTTYEARAYIGLLGVGETKASEIAHVSKVPRGRIYDVLEGLHVKGLVDFIPASPRRFRPVPISSLLERRKENLRATIEEIERKMETLASGFAPRQADFPRSSGEFLVFHKRKALIAKMREMIEKATHEVLVSSSEGCAIRGEKALLVAFQERKRAGVNLRMSCTVTKRNLQAIKALESALDIRHREAGNRATTVLVVDEEEALLCHWNPDDEDIFRGNDVAIWSNDPGVVQTLGEICRDAWEQGSELELRCWEVETGLFRERTELVRGTEPVKQAVELVARFTRKEAWASTLNSLVNADHEIFRPALEQLSRRGVRPLILVGYDGGSLEGVRIMADLGGEVRLSESLTLGRYLGMDRHQLLFFLQSHTPMPSDDAPDPSGIKIPWLIVRTRDKRAVEAFRTAFEYAWERATPLDEFLAHLGRTKLPQKLKEKVPIG